MRTEIEKTVKVTLTLDQTEARWLKNVMQSPLWGKTPEQEFKIDKQMRRIFWEAMHSSGI